MSLYIILIGVAYNGDLGNSAESDKHDRYAAIVQLIFSLGPAWSGSQSSVLLKTDVNREEIIRRVSSLVGHADFVGVMEIEAKSLTTIGWTPDEEAMDALYAKITKYGVSSSGHVYLRL